MPFPPSPCQYLSVVFNLFLFPIFKWYAHIVIQLVSYAVFFFVLPPARAYFDFRIQRKAIKSKVHIESDLSIEQI